MTALNRTPENTNLLQPTKFLLAFDRIGAVQFFCQTVNIPGISMGAAKIGTPMLDVYAPGNKLAYEDENESCPGYSPSELLSNDSVSQSSIGDRRVGEGMIGSKDSTSAIRSRTQGAKRKFDCSDDVSDSTPNLKMQVIAKISKSSQRRRR
jgi:hypothetical protein